MLPVLFDELLASLATRFVGAADKPEETAESTLRALWLLAAGQRVSMALAMTTTLPELDEAGHERLDNLLAARLGGTPVAYLTQRQRFMGLEFAVGPGALIPRVETELLGTAALSFLQQLPDTTVRQCLDIGTGCGNLAIALAVHCPGIRVRASDISIDAVRIARENTVRHGLQEDVAVVVGDLFEPFEADEHYGSYHLVVCNPPYVSTTQVPNMPPEISGHEPAAAFDGGFGGISVIRRLLRDAHRFLVPEGRLMFEVGAGQGESMIRNMSAGGVYSDILGLRDDKDLIRVVAARR